MAKTFNIVLTGFMGTGKTTVGRLLAVEFDFDFIDTDVLIEERHGPIAEIFASSGEVGFRRRERELVDELASRRGLLISTGGRLMLDPHNAAMLGDAGLVFCLAAEPEEILQRILAETGAAERPLLAVDDPGQRIYELLNERAEGYGVFTQVRTDGRTPEEITVDIATRVRSAD